VAVNRLLAGWRSRLGAEFNGLWRKTKHHDELLEK
jgi:hypothetical protein